MDLKEANSRYVSRLENLKARIETEQLSVATKGVDNLPEFVECFLTDEDIGTIRQMLVKNINKEITERKQMYI